MKKKLLSLLVCMVLLITSVMPAVASETEAQVPIKGSDVEVTEEIFVNPMYADVITEEDILEFASDQVTMATYAATEPYTTLADASEYVREAMKNREETVNLSYQGPKDMDWLSLVHDIVTQALVHTGAPTEGDYLAYQYKGYSVSYSRSSIGNVSTANITYTISYYTSAEQEADLDVAVAKLLKDLNLDGKSDYEKLNAIYDYMCANIKYDYEHLTDETYKLQYTAYAALMNNTSVCQGYATLLYRLALEEGIDCRIISGTGNGGAHAWNIVCLDGIYYNVDATWDATYRQAGLKYAFYLRCDSNFGDHVRDSKYKTDSFYAEFPMCRGDYGSALNDPCDVHTKGTLVASVAATCEQAGYDRYRCNVCNRLYDVTSAALGHDFSEKIEDASHLVAGTGVNCQSAKVYYYDCVRCGKIGAGTWTSTTYGAHSYSSTYTVDKAANCKEAGSKSKHCTVSGCTAKTAVTTIPAEAHNLVAKGEVAATCTKEGYTGDMVCTGCNTIITKGSVIAKKAHVWNTGVITIQPTLTTPGIKTYTCTTCKATKTESVYLAGGEVERIFGGSRYHTALAIADEVKAVLGVSKFSTIIIANGDNFPDALAGSYLAAKTNAPILMVNDNTENMTMILDYVIANLEENGKVYILGGTAAVPEVIEKTLRIKEFDVKRLKGASRYDTNLEILKEAGVTNEAILVCTGDAFADSLSASATGLPILLVDKKKDALTEEQKAFLAEAKREICIIGGEGAVSENYAKALEAYDANNTVDRINGKTRYDTSVEVAKTFSDNPSEAVVASATKFPDGLCGGPLAYFMDVPLILTSPTVNAKDMAPAVEYMTAKGIVSGKALGGISALADDVVRTIFDMGASDKILEERYD